MMKYIFLLIVVPLCIACAKVEVDRPQFEVTTEKYTVAPGEDVTFRFTGDPDQITFYSGEKLNDFAYRDGRVVSVSNLFASFQTNVRYGSQPDLLSAWLSTDYNGGGTIEDVRNATWSDELTRQFVFAPHSQNSNSTADAVSSGELDLNSAVEEGKPLYLAFRYKKKPDSEGGTQRNWFIRAFSVKAETILGSNEIVGTKSLGLVFDENATTDELKTSYLEPDIPRWTVRAPSALGNLNVEVWLITPPIDMSDINVGPDRGIPIKGFRDLKMEEYTYRYKEPGTYIAAFAATNSNIYGEDQVVRKITIEVKE